MSSDTLPEGDTDTPILEWLTGFALAVLLLWVPFVNYLITNSFGLTQLPVVICLGGMVALGFVVSALKLTRLHVWYALTIALLIALCADFTLHTIWKVSNYALVAVFLVAFGLFMKWGKPCHLIAIVFLGVMLLSTVALAAFKPEGLEFHLQQKSVGVRQANLPRIIHLILDEHIGVEGIPTEIDAGQQLRERIVQFYKKYQFVLYGGAYSHYFYTKNSVSHLLNFSAEADDAQFVDGDRTPYKLRANSYFNRLFQKQYQLHVIGGGEIDYCADRSFVLATCSDYIKHAGGDFGRAIPRLTFSIREQVRIILDEYLCQFGLYQGVRKYYWRLRTKLISQGFSLPLWIWDDTPIYPDAVNTMTIVPELWGRILGLSSGEFLFAHLIMPHFTYLYSNDCSTHQSLQNVMNGNPGLDRWRFNQGAANTLQSRQERYRLYFQQMNCLYTKLDELFQRMEAAGIFENSIIILHGDHGARLGIHDPYIEDLPILSREDYLDAFSTLFAAKIPGRVGSYNTLIAPVEELLAETVGMPFESGASVGLRRPDPFVYMMFRNSSELTPAYYPAGK